MSYLFEHPVEVLTASTPGELETLLHALDAAANQGLYAAGYMAFEAGYALEPRLRQLLPQDGRPLACFGLYAHRKTIAYRPELSSVTVDAPVMAMTEEQFATRVSRIRHHIERGDTYQVNLTTHVSWPHALSTQALLHHILAVQPVEFGACLNLKGETILSASPELFFRRNGSQIETRPMKGTVKRGRDLQEDADHMQWLANDEKNRAENLMIVDLLRNDLGRIAKTGSVRVDQLFAVEPYPTLHQMTSTVRAELRDGIGYAEIFRALFPSGSIVGAPKIKTMELIHSIEDAPRGVYTGCIGYLGPAGDACFSVAIRTITLRDGIASMGVGAGITYDSVAAEEYEETRLKSSFLQQDSQPFQLIETILWDSERFLLLNEHLERLHDSARYFHFACDLRRVQEQLVRSVQGISTPHRVRLLLAPNGETSITSTPYLALDRPLRVVISGQRMYSHDRFLRHKTTRRAVYDNELKAAQAHGWDEALFLNEHGHITEGAITNFFVKRGEEILTPPLSDGVLPGVLRRSLNCREVSLRLEDLLPHDELYLGNSVRGLQRIGSLERYP